jgi:hypothetical protein
MSSVTKITKSMQRIFDLINARPGLEMVAAPLDQRVEMFDENDLRWSSWTLHSVLDALVAVNMFPGAAGYADLEAFHAAQRMRPLEASAPAIDVDPHKGMTHKERRRATYAADKAERAIR